MVTVQSVLYLYMVRAACSSLTIFFKLKPKRVDYVQLKLFPLNGSATKKNVFLVSLRPFRHSDTDIFLGHTKLEVKHSETVWFGLGLSVVFLKRLSVLTLSGRGQMTRSGFTTAIQKPSYILMPPGGGTQAFFDRDARPTTNFNYPKK